MSNVVSNCAAWAKAIVERSGFGHMALSQAAAMIGGVSEINQRWGVLGIARVGAYTPRTGGSFGQTS